MTRQAIYDPAADEAPVPGVFECGDTLIHVGATSYVKPYWSKAVVGDDGLVDLLRTCGCGGWFRDRPENYIRVPEDRVVPVPPGLCT